MASVWSDAVFVRRSGTVRPVVSCVSSGPLATVATVEVALAPWRMHPIQPRPGAAASLVPMIEAAGTGGKEGREA